MLDVSCTAAVIALHEAMRSPNASYSWEPNAFLVVVEYAQSKTVTCRTVLCGAYSKWKACFHWGFIYFRNCRDEPTSRPPR